MKVLIIFMVTAIATLATTSIPQYTKQVLREWRKLAAPSMTRCTCQTNGQIDLVEGFFEFGEIPNDACFKCNIRCLQQGFGMISSTGNVNQTIYRAVFGVTHEVANTCGYNTHVDLCQRSFEIFNCTYNMAIAKGSVNVVPELPLQTSPQNTLWNVPPQYFLQK